MIESTPRWRAAAPDAVAEIAVVLAHLPWPVPEEHAEALLVERLGWRPDGRVDGIFWTGLGCTPDLATAGNARGELAKVRVTLLDREREESPERGQFVVDAFAAASTAIRARLGEPRRGPLSKQSQVFTWSMPSGAAIELVRSTTSLALKVECPMLATAHRILADHPDEWGD